MNKIIITLVVSLLCAQELGANSVRCNKPFDVRIVNESGLATINSHKGVRNVSRNSNILSDHSKTVSVDDHGAQLTLTFGPEGKKMKDTVRFYGKTSAKPTITLTSKGVVTEGFNAQRPKSFSLLLVNNSGGQVMVVSGNQFGLKNGTIIENNNQMKANIQPGSSATFKMGPETNKKMYTVNFINQDGKNPQLNFEGQTMFNKSIRQKDIITSIRPANRTCKPVYIKTQGQVRSHNLKQQATAQTINSKKNVTNVANAAQKAV